MQIQTTAEDHRVAWLAALAHMTGQFMLAWLLFIPIATIWHLFPILLTAALLFGIVSGIIARNMCNQHTPCNTQTPRS